LEGEVIPQTEGEGPGAFPRGADLDALPMASDRALRATNAERGVWIYEVRERLCDGELGGGTGAFYELL
jgi:hypothetical protein